MQSYPEFVTAIRMACALLFLTAAVSKLRHLATFAGVVANYRLLPNGLTRTVAYALPPFELTLAAALVAGIHGSEYAAAALLAVFAYAMAVNILRGRAHIDCGCFDATMRQPLRWSLVARNGVLALLLWAIANAGMPDWDRTLLLGTLGGAAIFVVIQGLNAVLAIPALRRPHAHG